MSIANGVMKCTHGAGHGIWCPMMIKKGSHAGNSSQMAREGGEMRSERWIVRELQGKGDRCGELRFGVVEAPK